jgi:succinyl-diaminopimelate desuccinylase
MDTLKLTQALVRCPSVTPDPDKTFDIISDFLEGRQFKVITQTFGDVTNLFAYKDFGGASQTHLMFLGHVDVVPAGNQALWRHPPFEATISDNIVWGRGTADMKGGIAAFLMALNNYMPPRGRISLLLTSDEEGPATDGIKKMVPWLQTHHPDLFQPDLCIIGEPTSEDIIGDTLKIGRRGSLTGTLTLKGHIAHIAYPHRGPNPLPALLDIWRILSESLSAHNDDSPSGSIFLDEGYQHFDPSHVTLTGAASDTMVMNMTPGSARLTFGIRFNPNHHGEALKDRIREVLAKHITLPYDLSLSLHGNADLVTDQAAIETIARGVQRVTGKVPTLSTAGGTSDGRFLAHVCPAIELGLKHHTIHQVDEHVPVADLTSLEALYTSVLSSFFEKDN